jgi:hypothetical protein
MLLSVLTVIGYMVIIISSQARLPWLCLSLGRYTVSGWAATSSFSRRIVKSWRDASFKIRIRTAALDS